MASGMVASVALHLAAVLLWPSGPPADPTPGGTGDRPSAAGPEGIQVVEVRAAASPGGRQAGPRAADVPTPSRPVPTPARMEPVPVNAPTPRWVGAGGGGSGGDPDGGTGSGSSAGEGSDGEGDGDAFSPPVPRSLLPDWSPPEEVRGHRVTVRVEVDERGRPTGRVELEPPTPSESFNRELRRRMARLEFLPARRDGRPVAAWAEITFTFGGPSLRRAGAPAGGG